MLEIARELVGDDVKDLRQLGLLDDHYAAPTPLWP
jgi:hypothetical protein